MPRHLIYSEEERQFRLLQQGYTDRALCQRAALGAMVKEFYWECETHGLALHWSSSGQCILCHGYGKHDRSMARLNGQANYPAECATHGRTAHYTTNGKCATCYTSAGLARQFHPTDSRAVSRRSARLRGERTFLATCGEHGLTAHDVHRGKCQTCYTSAGYKRASEDDAPPVRKGQTRAEAKASGAKRYWAHCRKHGDGWYLTGYGRCARCIADVGD